MRSNSVVFLVTSVAPWASALRADGTVGGPDGRDEPATGPGAAAGCGSWPRNTGTWNPRCGGRFGWKVHPVAFIWADPYASAHGDPTPRPGGQSHALHEHAGEVALIDKTAGQGYFGKRLAALP